MVKFKITFDTDNEPVIEAKFDTLSENLEEDVMKLFISKATNVANKLTSESVAGTDGVTTYTIKIEPV